MTPPVLSPTLTLAALGFAAECREQRAPHRRWFGTHRPGRFAVTVTLDRGLVDAGLPAFALERAVVDLHLFGPSGVPPREYNLHLGSPFDASRYGVSTRTVVADAYVFRVAGIPFPVRWGGGASWARPELLDPRGAGYRASLLVTAGPAVPPFYTFGRVGDALMPWYPAVAAD